MIRRKMILDPDGTQKKMQMEIEIEGKGGNLALGALQGLAELMNTVDTLQEVKAVENLSRIIEGYIFCCQTCGFLTEKSAEDIAQASDNVAEFKIQRIERSKMAAGQKKANKD